MAELKTRKQQEDAAAKWLYTLYLSLLKSQAEVLSMHADGNNDKKPLPGQQSHRLILPNPVPLKKQLTNVNRGLIGRQRRTLYPKPRHRGQEP